MAELLLCKHGRTKALVDFVIGIYDLDFSRFVLRGGGRRPAAFFVLQREAFGQFVAFGVERKHHLISLRFSV